MVQVDPGPESGKLPAKVEVVIIGGGIVGASATYFLAKQGVSVLLCEKGVIGGEQSSRNWGFVRQQGRAPQEIPLIMESLRLWRGLDAEIGDNTGFFQGGVVYATETEKGLAQYETWAELAKQYQLDTRLLSAAELKEEMPDLTGDWAGAMTTPSDGARRTDESSTRDCPGGSQDRRQRGHQLRRARPGHRRWARCRCGHRAGPR